MEDEVSFWNDFSLASQTDLTGFVVVQHGFIDDSGTLIQVEGTHPTATKITKYLRESDSEQIIYVFDDAPPTGRAFSSAFSSAFG